MKKILSSFLFLTAFGTPVLAGDHIVESFRLNGPVALSRPFMLDSVDVSGHAFSDDAYLSRPLRESGTLTLVSGQKLRSDKALALASLSFDMEATMYTDPRAGHPPR